MFEYNYSVKGKKYNSERWEENGAMRKFLIILCIFSSFGALVGCDLTKLPDAILEDGERQKLNKPENVTFAEAVFNEPLREIDTDIESADPNDAFKDGIPSEVDCGLAVWEITERNRVFVYHKFGINTTGVIIFESKNSDELKFGDKIVSINGTEIRSARDIKKAIEGYWVGDGITVTVLRDGEEITVVLILTKRVPCGVTFK